MMLVYISCAQQAVEPLYRHGDPQTNGMVDRFNGRITEVLATTYFDSSHTLADTLTRYVRLYNHQIPQKVLGHLSPVQAFKEWQHKDPKRFKKRVGSALINRIKTIFNFKY